jgi:hypothetical protein
MANPSGAVLKGSGCTKRSALRNFSRVTSLVLVFSFVVSPAAPVLAQDTSSPTTPADSATAETAPTDVTPQVLPAVDIPAEQGATPETTPSDDAETPATTEAPATDEAVSDWTSPLGVEGSLTNPGTPGGRQGGEAEATTVHP